MSARHEVGDIVYYFAEDAVFKGQIVDKHAWNNDIIKYHILFYHESLWLTTDKFNLDPVTAWPK